LLQKQALDEALRRRHSRMSELVKVWSRTNGLMVRLPLVNRPRRDLRYGHWDIARKQTLPSGGLTSVPDPNRTLSRTGF
jgi:hypothetical protein